MNSALEELEKVHNLAIGLIRAYAEETVDEGEETELFESLYGYPKASLKDIDILFKESLPVLTTSLQQVAFVVAVAGRMDSDVNAMLTILFGRNTMCISMAKMIVESLSEQDIDYSDLEDAYISLGKICHFQRTDFFPDSSIEIDDRVVGFLAHSSKLPERVEKVISKGNGQTEIFCDSEKVELLQAEYERGHRIFCIKGAVGRGRKTICEKAFEKLGYGLIYVDVEMLFTSARKPEEILELIWEIRREAYFEANSKVCIVFHDFKEEFNKKEDKQWFYRISVEPFVTSDMPVVFIAQENMNEKLLVGTNFCVNINLAACDREQLIALWQGYGSKYGLLEKDFFDSEVLATIYRMNPSEIAMATMRMAELAADKSLTTRDIATICTDIVPMRAKGRLAELATDFTWDDLKLPESQIKMLKSVCSQVLYRKKVFDDWGLKKKYPYGAGTSALFCGNPGTGKTMAANVIASELGLPLYTLNIAEVVDKYIGETEKKLEEIFRAAEKSNTILFFDEADVIFGKRSEVKEAKDRYANTEVAYLLQRIERYPGLVIMATNLKANIDTAFLRRIRYVVDFPIPEESIRLQIWKGCFEELDTGNIDYDFLAHSFEYTGGEIKNAALNAAFIAAESDEKLSMVHIVKSIARDVTKNGGILTQEQFGNYLGLIK